MYNITNVEFCGSWDLALRKKKREETKKQRKLDFEKVEETKGQEGASEREVGIGSNDQQKHVI